jgi:transcription termination factor NusB
MPEESLTTQARKLEKYIYTLPMAKRLNELSRDSKNSIMDLKDLVTSVRDNVSKYETTDDAKEKQEYQKIAIEKLVVVQDQILKTSQYDLLDTADVAHLSAIAEYLSDNLQ